MKQVFLSGQGEISVLDAPVPGRLKGSLLVRNRYSLISTGTEGSAATLHEGLRGLYEKATSSTDRINQVWSMARSQGVRQTVENVKNKLADRVAIGYSSAGVVVQVDDESMPFRPGDMVACMGAGFATHSEYIAVPRNLVAKIPENVDVRQSAFGALGCIAMQGIRRLELTPGERVGVIGLGLIGQITMRLLAGMGYRPFGIDLWPERVELASEVANSEVWTLHDCDSEQRVTALTDGEGLDGVIVSAASRGDEAVNLAFDLCRESGRVSVVGEVGLNIDRPRMYRKELELRMSRSYGPGRYDPEYEVHGRDYALEHVRWSEGRNLEHFLWMLESGIIDLSGLVSDCYEISEAPVAYRSIKGGDPRVLAVLLDYGDLPDLAVAGHEVNEGARVDIGSTSPGIVKSRGEGPLRLGVIGAGGYARGMHLPSLSRLEEDFSVSALVSRSGASAASAARRFHIPVAASDPRVILEDPHIDAVLIATRHASHAGLVLGALEAGKHVFVEKPMATTIEDAERIVDAADRTGLTVRVGFNRRFSPYVQALRDAVGTMGVRILLTRVNIGAVGSRDWSNTAEEGGRLLGEGVHFYDLANWFMEGEPDRISAAMAGPAETLNPNASVLLNYADGSHASILYTSLGSKRMGKELYEAFGNNRSGRMEDFASLKIWGARVGIRLKRRDKGQRECLREFAAATRGIGHVVSGADARAGLAATRIAVEVVKLSAVGHHGKWSGT